MNPENLSLSWKRPSGPPKVWKRFEAKGKTGTERKEGKPLRFTIEEIPPERYDEALAFMTNYFLIDEPLCRCLNIKNDPDGVEDFRNLWQFGLNQGITIGLFLDDPDVDKREIVGTNMIIVLTHEDEESLNKLKFKSAAARTIMGFITSVTAEANVLDHYKVDKYICAHGLLVDPRYRGYSLGGHLLNVRNDIGREYRIPATETAFTASASQILASRNGFELLVEKKYSNARDNEGELLFPNINAESIKIMAKRFY